MRIIGVLERRGGWSFQAKHVSDVENFLADGIPSHADSRMPQRFNVGLGHLSWRNRDVFGDCARVYPLERVAKSIRKTYARSWKMWVSWKVLRWKGNWLERDMSETERVEELAEGMVYCSVARQQNRRRRRGRWWP